MQQKRPQVPPQFTDTDKSLERLCIAFVLGLIVGSILAYVKLPDTIATHFDLAGEPDAWGSKSAIFIFPALAIGIYVLFTLIARQPHILNYPVQVTEENAEAQYTNATRMLRYVKLGLLIGACVYLLDAIGRAAGKGFPGPSVLIIELVLILAPICYFVYKMFTVK